jgi:hypothetical protein
VEPTGKMPKNSAEIRRKKKTATHLASSTSMASDGCFKIGSKKESESSTTSSPISVSCLALGPSPSTGEDKPAVSAPVLFKTFSPHYSAFQVRASESTRLSLGFN